MGFVGLESWKSFCSPLWPRESLWAGSTPKKGDSCTLYDGRSPPPGYRQTLTYSEAAK